MKPWNSNDLKQHCAMSIVSTLEIPVLLLAKFKFKCFIAIDESIGCRADILGLHSANERWRYKVTMSLVGGRKPKINPGMSKLGFTI